MALFELIIGLLLLGAVFALWAERIGAPYPALLALAGAALALLPGAPRVMLEPNLALALFVAPVLLDAAYDASPRDLRRNLAPVINLAILTVLLTTGAVALVARWLTPGMGWAAALALGAIVAPPDASAASAVLRRLRPPHRLRVILEGESLFNDATALLVYRIAVAAAMTGVVSRWSIAPTLVLTCGGAVLLGYGCARLYLWLTARISDIAISVLLQFVGTFSVWLLAERLNLSAIITMIAYAMTLARRVPGRVDARHRIASYAVWEVAVFVLNVLAFVLIGLQLRAIVARAHAADWHAYLECALAVCATVVLVRFAWIFGYFGIRRLLLRTHLGRPPVLPSARAALVVCWSGMRGIVTLAAAVALPDGSASEAFPYRDLIVLCAFSVVLTTLVLQGLTLGPLMRRVGLKDDGTVEREQLLARAATARAALSVLDEAPDDAAFRILRLPYQTRLRSWDDSPALDAATSAAPAPRRMARVPPPAALPVSPSDRLAELQLRVVAAQRQCLMQLRARGIIGDDAFHALEEEIDLLELAADARIRPAPEDVRSLLR